MRIIPVVTFATVALSAASAAAQAPGLPRAFNAIAINSPEPTGGGSFGWGIASADLTGDGRLDLLVAQGQTAPTRVFAFDGASGAHIDTIVPPELNPGDADPVIGFVYVETMPDIGSCPGGTTSQICPNPVVGPGDRIPEILVGARALRVNPTDSSIPATNADPQIGRGYVLDGATRAVLKRIDMPRADRMAQAALPGTSTPQFGRVMASPQALPPCAGVPEENNNQGVGPCPDMPRTSRIGDLDGGGQPDIVITARSYRETPAQAAATSQCRTSTASTCTSGKAWAYRGERIAGSNPREILDEAMYAIQNPLAQTGGQEFGGNLYRVGDINTNSVTTNCDATPTNATCAPEFVIPARNLSYPFANPTPEFNSVGAAFLINGRTGEAIPIAGGGNMAIVSPEPQRNSQFSGSFNGGRAVGDLGASTAPDILLPAAFQNALTTDDGKIWAFNAVGGGGGATGSWQFASMTDPTAYPGSNFGGAFTGVGNLVGGPGAPANELLVGGFHFDTFTEVSNSAVEDVHFVNVQTGNNLMTIPNPVGARGEGFGVGLVPMGDLNGDGFLDFAASSYLANVTTGGDGRAYIFYSDNSAPPPPPAAAPPQVTGPAAPPAGAREEQPLLRPGACANRTVGTDRGERIRGTIAGDEIFGFGGNDSISGYAGRDCIDGGRGDDRLYGGDDNDKLVAGSGNDRLYGQDDRDELFGGTGHDRLEGGAANDMLAGGPGNDDLIGGSGNDRLFGEAGRDRIVGGGGRNQIDGGSGNDSIAARNGERDRIICGPGRDIVHADRYDRLNGCEVVRTGGKITNRTVLPPRARASSATSSKGTRR